RYPTLSRVLWANKQVLKTVPVTLDGGAAREGVVRYYRPTVSASCRFISGNPEEQARQFIALCRGLGVME
ncbi:MAG: hypothetical protein N2Z74_03965, partial [Syntrophales bacterium]|nr:hypothetical protein [Syntrophales bacterium]